MRDITNPFIVKGRIPSAYFCDRVDETEKLTRELRSGNNVVIMSSRRLGKTGLIQHCYDQSVIADNYYVFFVDILETSSLRDFTYMFSKAVFDTLKTLGQKFVDNFVQTLKSLQAGWGYDPFSGMPKFTLSMGEISEPEVTLGEVFALMEKADKHCIVAIDEFQQIAKYPEKNVEAILRSHIQHLSNCDFIFAGSERHLLSEMFNAYGRPFYNSTSVLNLNPILKERYVEFVILNFQNFGKSIQANNAARIYDLYEGNTFCMQKTFNVAFEMTEKAGECTLEILQKAVDEILSDRERDFQNLLANVTTRPKEVLFAMAMSGKVDKPTSASFLHRYRLQSASSVQSSIKQLLQDELITFTIEEKQRKVYFLSDPLLKLWIQQKFGDGFTI